MSVQEIEVALQSLSIEELTQVRDKAAELHQARWDAQLIIDLESGRLDAWIDEANQVRKEEARNK
ncbi:hypothetical protein [Fibrella aquatica]|jgi:hypothetical protein|uniref:hypothetical protein n=1 Tax=Fibrella aquatica TaxID=3242487 RepID=UPI003520AC53